MPHLWGKDNIPKNSIRHWWFYPQVYEDWHSSKGTHGCRKFWNIHARKTETDLSGKPLCGLHSWWSFLLSCWRSHCFWMKEDSKGGLSFSLVHPFVKRVPIARIWLLILSLRFLYSKEIVWRANRACIWGSNSVAAWNADITVWISSKHWLYWSSTWVQKVWSVVILVKKD